jgi:peptide/nickel transport system substrate-binding protein
MKLQYPLAACLASLLVALGGCGGSDGGSSSTSPGAGPTATVQPPDGVPAGTRPLPLPEYGKAYNNPQPRENIQDGGTLTLPIHRLGPNFNNLHVDGHILDVRLVMNWLAPRLWDYGPSGGATPNQDYLLSAELVSESPQVVKYVLNPNARWNDGTAIDWTAFDAVWRTQRGGDDRYSPPSTTGYESISNVAKGEQDNEVIVTFAEPFYPIEYVFAEVLHPKNLDPQFYATGWINAVHSDLLAGPFVVASLTENRIELARNPKWWGNAAKLERVVYRQMELNASINAFQNGEIDATNVAIADRLRQISGMSNVQIRRGFDVRTAVYILGQASELFKDEAGRKAFMLGTDRRLLAEIDFQGLDWEEEPPGSATMFPWQQGYRDNIADLHFDPEPAKTLLDSSGWIVGADGYRYKDGKLAEFTYVTFGDDPLVAALARAQQQMARDIGLQMHIDIRRSADFAPTFTKGRRDFDVVIMAWQAESPFEYTNGCQLYCSDSESNFTDLGTPELDAQLRSIPAISDAAEAIRVANEAEAMALHLYGLLPLMNGPRMDAVKKGLVHYGPAGFWVPPPEDIGWQKDSAASPGADSSTGGP